MFYQLLVAKVYIYHHIAWIRGAVQKKHSIFTDIIQIEVDPPPSHPIFDKFIFDKVLIMLTSLPPLEFLTKIMKLNILFVFFDGTPN